MSLGSPVDDATPAAFAAPAGVPPVPGAGVQPAVAEGVAADLSHDDQSAAWLRAVALLQHALVDAYQYDGPYVIGGPAAQMPYSRQSPYNTACEFAVLAVTSSGAATGTLTATGAGVVAFSAATTYGAFGDTNSARRDIPLAAGGASTVRGPDVWFPLAAHGEVLLQVASASDALCVTLAFRRRMLPDDTARQG